MIRDGQRQPFPGNIIPKAESMTWPKNCSPIIVSAPSYSSQNLAGNPVTTDNYDQYGGRVDVNLNAKNSLFGQYVNENSPSHVNAACFLLRVMVFR
jgi:hypothetical protein